MNDTSLPRSVRVVALAALGLLLFTTATRLTAAFTSTDAPVLWWAGRASGLVAYLALWLSMLFGTLVSARSTLLDKKLTMELHRQWSLAAVLATVVHVVTLLVHPDSDIPLASAVIPYLSERLRGPLALGTFATWGLALVAVSSWLQKRLPYGAWRAVHALSFGTMLLAFAHSISAGTDTGVPFARGLYAVTAALLVGAIAGRVVAAVLAQTPRRAEVTRRAPPERGAS